MSLRLIMKVLPGPAMPLIVRFCEEAVVDDEPVSGLMAVMTCTGGIRLT
jgi:hypothetical protein